MSLGIYHHHHHYYYYYYYAILPALNTIQYIAQGLVYPMKTVHTVQSFLDTFCQNGLQFRIICA